MGFFFVDENRRPKANAGGDRSVSLPLRWVSLDGSNSSDDLAVRSWLWTRESDSLATGSIVADTDRTSTLMVSTWPAESCRRSSLRQMCVGVCDLEDG